VVEQQRWLLRLLNEPLVGRAGEEAAVRRADAPREVGDDRRGAGWVEGVQLAVEGVGTSGSGRRSSAPHALELPHLKEAGTRAVSGGAMGYRFSSGF